MKEILVLDDDKTTLKSLEGKFRQEGFMLLDCDGYTSPGKCLKALLPDMVLIGMLAFDMQGLDVCRQIRAVSDLPVIMYSSFDSLYDRVIGLEIGADDFLSSPFDESELLARIKAVMRRYELCEKNKWALRESDGLPDIVDLPGLHIDRNRYIVKIDGKRIKIPPKELELLFFLVSRPNRVFTREQLLENVWDYDFFGESRTVDVHIKRIREKLDKSKEGKTWNLSTVWGVGYKFEIT